MQKSLPQQSVSVNGKTGARLTCDVCGRRERGLRVAPLLHACPLPPRACVFARMPRCLCVQSMLMGVCVTMLCCFKVTDRSKCGRYAELATTDGTSEWRSLGSPCHTVPLSFPETLTCDVLLRCPRVGFSGAVRGTQSSAHPWRSAGREIVQADRVATEGRTGRETRDRDEGGEGGAVWACGFESWKDGRWRNREWRIWVFRLGWRWAIESLAETKRMFRLWVRTLKWLCACMSVPQHLLRPRSAPIFVCVFLCVSAFLSLQEVLIDGCVWCDFMHACFLSASLRAAQSTVESVTSIARYTCVWPHTNLHRH